MKSYKEYSVSDMDNIQTLLSGCDLRINQSLENAILTMKRLCRLLYVMGYSGELYGENQYEFARINETAYSGYYIVTWND